MMSDRLLPCRVLLVWSLIVALILPVPLGGCVARKQDGVGFVSGASSDRAASASRADVAAVGPEKDADRERPRGLDAALFNVAATFMGLPGLAPSSGARDEGLGYHQDGTARRAGSADAFDGRQARAYMGAGLMGDGAFSSPDGTLLPRRLGDEYSGRRRDYASRGFENFNLMDMALDRGLNYGMGMLNSAGEAALSGLVDNGRARLNFQLDRDGRFSGEGDVLLPFRDAPQHTLFTQIGARSMDVSGGEEDGSQRWIGNFGLGHRWFPFAESMEEAGNLMLGWNVFFDNDFSRSHQRGGAGLEARYDWFHLAANYYTPLSGWKNSRDFDGDFVEERPARGWDARAKAYLPFYRNVALTGSFSQWYGDNVAMYGSSDDLEKDPRVWSYGVEYTPIPLLSAFARQRSTERGKPDTEFGLQFTWHFDMPWEEQTSHAKVAELRTVSGSRHEFVDRENRIILEYRAKNAGRIEYLGPVSGQTNAFAFRVTDGLGRAWAGKTVWVRADNVTLAVAPQPSRSLLALAGDVLGGLFGAREAHAATASHSYVTDSQGCFTVRVTSPLSGPVTLHVRAGENERSFTVNVVANATLKMSASSAALTQGTTRRVTFTFTRNGVAQSGLEVRFAANAAFRELAQGAVTDKTDSDGRVTLELTALTNDTSQTISVEADGQTLTQSFTVTPGKYALTAEPGSLTQHRETEIVFTLTQGGIPVPKGTQITLSGEGVTFDGKAQYTCVTEDASGAITAKVIVSRTDASIIATVDGGATATVKLQVTAAKYSLEASPGTLTQHKAEKVVFTLKANNQPLPDAKVTFTRSDNFSGLPTTEKTTDSEGNITVDNLTALTGGGRHGGVHLGHV
ncbi:inverse autotransporter beta domain-containing protein, partial [uncultured Desulfovibrio sp.]|uniref:inverse autotransporter beta domain-containing protein n=1 Tax=uncultured Desulfovibrio sp. TaxID=167968 RepID=UPI00262D0959